MEEPTTEIVHEKSHRCARSKAWWRASYRDFRWLLKQKTTYPTFMIAFIALFLNADQNLIAPNLTQIARDFNLTDIERDTMLGGQITVGFFVVGGIAALIVGWLADKVNRKNLFCLVIVIGELSCFCTLFVTDYWGLFITRAVTGVSIGGANPLIMSMLGDMYDDRNRGKAISFVQIMLSLGIIVGQSVAGFVGPKDVLGWRAPFAIISAPTIILAPIFFFTVKDPPRGANEKAIKAMLDGSTEISESDVYAERMDCSKLKILLMNKTALLAFIQGIPGSLPWGVMLVYFQDFLVQDIGPLAPGGITVQESTTVVLMFGVGSGLGLIAGGLLADKLWKRDPRWVPLLMAITTAVGALPIYGLINGAPISLLGYAFATLPSGILASITGTAIRTVLMNVTLPETRGTAFAFHTLFDDIGRGLGPLWVSLLIAGTGGRVPGFNLSIGGWFVCSVILFLMTCTIKGDFLRLQKATQAAADRRQRGIADTSMMFTRKSLGDATPLESMTPQSAIADAAGTHEVDLEDQSHVQLDRKSGDHEMPANPLATQRDAEVRDVQSSGEFQKVEDSSESQEIEVKDRQSSEHPPKVEESKERLSEDDPPKVVEAADQV